MYALGYFGHVLYQFDTRTKKVRSVAVGSAAGHVSRNFFADDRGHAFVPRIVAPTPATPTAALVEFDAELKEVGSQPLGEYFESAPWDSHGIVAVSPDGEHGWYFTTGKGRLYHEVPRAPDPSVLTDLGWLHPDGPRYPSTMFFDERTGNLYVGALASHYGGGRVDWVTRGRDGKTTVTVMPFGSEPEFPAGALMYGSMTRDLAGRLYMAGTMNFKPLVLQVTPAN